MLILRHNILTADELFDIERKLLKANQQEDTTPSTLDFTLYDKTRADIYGMLLLCFQRLDLLEKLGWSPSVLLDFLIDVDQGYHPNAYHSFHHAVDVTLVLYHMIQEYDIVHSLSPVDIALLFIAGLCHDIGHPGLNNNYQVNMKTDLARRFKNSSVLESYSCTLALDLVEKHHLFSSIENYSQLQGDAINEQEAKLYLTKMILATDMIFHYELQENMAAILDLFQSDDGIRLVAPTQRIKTSSVVSSSSSSSSLSSSALASPPREATTTVASTAQAAEEMEEEEQEAGTINVPKLRDIFANLGSSSPLLYFLDHYQLRPREQANTGLSATCDCPTPFPTLSTSSTSSTASSSTTATTQQGHTQEEEKNEIGDPNATKLDSAGGLSLGREHRLILCQSLLHAADISNPLRPWPICYTWSQRVCTEFFNQGDMERMHGLPISPNMDRRKTNQLTVGLQFSDYVVSPYFEIFAALFPKADALVVLLKSNRLRWLETIQQENRTNKKRSRSKHEEDIMDQGLEELRQQKQQRQEQQQRYSDIEEEDEEEQEEKEEEDLMEEDEDDFGDYGCIPAPLVPAGVLNPAGRRVSVAAGMAVIPSDLEKRIIGTGKRRRVYWGIRTGSEADAIHQSRSQQQRLYHLAYHSKRSSSLGGEMISDHTSMTRRKSEQPTSLY